MSDGKKEGAQPKVLDFGSDGLKTLAQLEEETGINRKTLYGRWIKMGSPVKPDWRQRERLLRTPSYSSVCTREVSAIVMPGNRKMTISQILKLPSCKISRASIGVRIKSNKGVIWEDDLLPVRKGSPEWGKLNTTYHRKCDDLPHITAGDLAHLSDKGENTGAGRGEIPDDVWINRFGNRKAITGAVLGI